MFCNMCICIHMYRNNTWSHVTSWFCSTVIIVLYLLMIVNWICTNCVIFNCETLIGYSEGNISYLMLITFDIVL